MTKEEQHRLRIWRLCEECASAIYDKTPPSVRYAQSVARLLYGTAAQEGNMQWERQRSCRFDDDTGGFSKWQLEKDSVECSIAMLRSRPNLARHATEFLFNDPHATTEWIRHARIDIILEWMRLDNNDKVGCLFARLHYMRVPQPIPDSPRAQGEYWKDHFNTVYGKGTVSEYLKNWYSFWTPDMAQAAMKD